MATPRGADRTGSTGLPGDYAERVYAGVLGKIIGVYLGRPFEGWNHHRIMSELGEVRYYVNDRLDVALKNHRLVVTDDDITGTFAFARAIGDYPGTAGPTAVQVGRTWLNYIVPERTVLWWGGRGNSTEHTAYLRLLDGTAPPHTGSIAANGRVVAEQVGAQIFVEGFAMACPGDPERAADLAAAAASVSHDGEALHAARVVAAMVAQAFVEPDVGKLLDCATALIPAGSLIARVIGDVREWHATGEDWRAGRERIDREYGYHRYGGNCHVVPNHALVVHSLLHGGGDLGRSLSIVTSCGWDTDSNGGNVGVVAGVRGGLAGIDSGVDWRGPVADRMYLPTADGGGSITDAAREALTVAGYGRALRGLPPEPPRPRFHFELPGSVQGFAPERPGTLLVANAAVPAAGGGRALGITYTVGSPAAAVLTPTFLTPDTVSIPPYGMAACPTLYPGQWMRARVLAGTHDVTCRLVVRTYDGRDAVVTLTGPERRIAAGEAGELAWRVPDTGGHPVADAGLSVAAPAAAAGGTGRAGDAGTVYLDHLGWDGAPEVTLGRPADGGRMWRHAWVDAADRYDDRWPEPYRIVQNRGTGLLVQGTHDWRDYRVTVDVTPHLARSVGLAARVGGLRRHYLLELSGRDTVSLVRERDGRTVLAERAFGWEFGTTYRLGLTVTGQRIRAGVDGEQFFDVEDPDGLGSGGVALVVEEGRSATTAVRIEPAGP